MSSWDQSRRRDKADGEAFLTSRQTEAEGDMGFAGAAIAKCDDVFTTLDVFTTRQFQNHHLVERWHGFEVEAVQAFDGGELTREVVRVFVAAWLIAWE